MSVPVQEKTCGSVLFTRQDGLKKYLLIENLSGHIGFPKGHTEYGETEAQTARREVFEETGIIVEIDVNTRQEYTYINKDNIVKNCVYFCNEFSCGEINIQKSEISNCWLVPYGEAMSLLNLSQDKAVLEKADKIYD